MTARGGFAARLLAWYDAGHRDLPWRQTKDPWAIWVSEVMLQQTRVEVARDAFVRFVQEFRTPASFAAADDAALHRAWRGLGYYRRARLLREGARQVVALHRGLVPADARSLAALPGIGSYTLGAVSSIAFGLPLPAVDGNVERVFARHSGLEGDPRRSPQALRLRQEVCRRMDRTRAGDFNQALMELGATLCTPKSPRCHSCPVADDCVAWLSNRVHELPTPRPRKALVDVQARAIVVPIGDGVLALRLPEGQINAGQLDLPGPGLTTCCPDGASLVHTLATTHGLTAELTGEQVSVRHGITHHRIVLTAHAGRCQRPTTGPFVVARPDDEQAPWSTAARKVFRRTQAMPLLWSGFFAREP